MKFGFLKNQRPLAITMLAISIIGCSEVAFENKSLLSEQEVTPPDPPPGGEIVNSYFFVERQADVLFVIDNSGSMAEEQALLQNGFPSFTSALNAYSGGTLNWRIAITTTDVTNTGDGRQGALLPFSGAPTGTYFLDSDMDVNAANSAFQATVVLGTSGSGDERGIAAARMAAEREFNSATTRHFIRADTPLAVIVLSDEDERSTRNPASGEFRPLEPIDEPNNFVAGIQAADTLSTNPKTISFHSIVTSTQACLDGAGAYMGTTYMALSSLTNGIIGDICAMTMSYQNQLNSLAERIVNEARTYTLPCGNVQTGSTQAYKQSPIGALVPVGSTFLAPNRLILDTAPEVGSLIKARFTCLD